jgi:hypothetical protein
MPDHKEMTQLKVILFSLRLHTQSSRSYELHTAQCSSRAENTPSFPPSSPWRLNSARSFLRE